MNTGANDTGPQLPDPDCRLCRHFHVTWEPQLPYGCRAMGFRSAVLPSLEVRLADGEACLAFAPRPPATAAQVQSGVRGRSLNVEC